MCGIGPFIPQKDTPFKNEKSGTAEETAYYLSIIRLIKPNILLPATTALGTIKEGGRELGILSGANVLMPNLLPFQRNIELPEGNVLKNDVFVCESLFPFLNNNFFPPNRQWENLTHLQSLLQWIILYPVTYHIPPTEGYPLINLPVKPAN